MFSRTNALPREHVVFSQSQRCFGLPLGLISPGIDGLPQGYNLPDKNKDTLLGRFPEQVPRLVCTDYTQVWTHKLIVGGNRVIWAIPRITPPLILPLIPSNKPSSLFPTTQLEEGRNNPLLCTCVCGRILT